MFYGIGKVFSKEKTCFWMLWNWNSYAEVMNSQNYKICNLGKKKNFKFPFRNLEILPIQCCPCYHLQNII